MNARKGGREEKRKGRRGKRRDVEGKGGRGGSLLVLLILATALCCCHPWYGRFTRWTALSRSTDCLSSMSPLMGVQPDSGSTDPGAAVTRPDSDMTAGLHIVLAGCTLAFKSCDTGFFELVNRLMTLRTPG